jgi:hypothetical protein
MDTLSSFINDIVAFDFTLPYWFKVSFLVVCIITFSIGAYFTREFFETSYLRSGFLWFVFIAIVNLTTMLVIYLYNNRVTKTVGKSGRKGKKGKKGKVGKSTSCGYCVNNIFIQSTHKADTICLVSNPLFQSTANAAGDILGTKTIVEHYNYFQNRITDGYDINYTSFVNNIVFAKPLTADVDQKSIENFRVLMHPNYISMFLIQNINEQMTAASDEIYGKFTTPVPKVGYVTLGDSVYGGTEDFNLNSFVVSGNIMYPSAFDKLVTFTSYNLETKDLSKYTIWRPVQQTVNDSNYKGQPEKNEYRALGDICKFGIDNPNVNDYALIKETCLDVVSINDLKLAFIYSGPLDWVTDNEGLDYTQTDTYLVQNKIVNNLQYFSVWRTPMNTFISNCNFYNDLVNNTIYYNLFNGIDEAFNEYGNISDEYKQWIVERLTSISIPQLISAMIFCRHFQAEFQKELMYYINKYQFQVPEFKNRKINSMSFAELYNLVDKVNKEYEEFNKELVKKASVSLSSKKPIVYNSKQEKHLPSLLMQIFNNALNTIIGIPVQVENTYTLYDVMTVVFQNGLETRVAIDSDGIAEGGILLNEVQDMLLRVCKIITPPNKPAYTIKDECLGTFTLDRSREEKIKILVDMKATYNNYTNTINNDPTKYEKQMISARQYEDLAERKMGTLCGHITNYMDKIRRMDLDEFTTNRIEGLIVIYKEINEYLKKVINTA